MVINGEHQKYMNKNKKVSIPKITVNGKVLNPINYNSNTNVVTFDGGIQYNLKTKTYSLGSSSTHSNSNRNQAATQSRPKPTTRPKPKPASSSKTSNIDIESALGNGSDEGGSAD